MSAIIIFDSSTPGWGREGGGKGGGGGKGVLENKNDGVIIVTLKPDRWKSMIRKAIIILLINQ